MRILRIDVCEEDILLATPGNAYCTPCANAIRRTLPIFATVEVAGNSVQCFTLEGDFLLSSLPADAAHFEKMFHRGHTILPFSFGIRTPE